MWTSGTAIFNLVAFRLRKDGICLCHNIPVDYDAGSHLCFLHAEKASLHCQASNLTDALHDRYGEKHYVTKYRPRKSKNIYIILRLRIFRIKLTINTIYMVFTRNEKIHVRHLFFNYRCKYIHVRLFFIIFCIRPIYFLFIDIYIYISS